jgi:large repetitive protein
MNSLAKEHSRLPGIILAITLGLSLSTAGGCGGGSSASTTPIQQQPTLEITTASLQAGNVGTFYQSTICTTGGVLGGATWNASSGLPPGLTLSGFSGENCSGNPNTGALSGTPTAKGTFTFRVTITDTAGTSATKTLSVTIGAPLPLSITTPSPFPDATVNSAYTWPLQAAGGVAPFTWRLASGSSLPLNLALDTSGNLSSGNATLTTFGNFTFTVMVTDSETPAQTASATFSLTIRTVLIGQYVFLFHGFDANGAVVAAGSFTADGLGKITDGVEDVNRHVPGPAANVPFTGTYAIGLDNRGMLTLTSSLGTSTFAFALRSPNNIIPNRARLIETDASGTHGSGEMQSGVGACPPFASANSTGPYAYVFGISGDDLNKGRVALAGSFQADAAGHLSSGSLDENDAGTLTSNVAWTGTYAAPANSPRCSMTLTMVGSPTRNFAFYPPFLVQVDAAAGGTPLTAGKVWGVAPDSGAPAGALFTNASLGAPIVGGLTGYSLDTNAPDVSLFFFSPDGKGNVTMTVDENSGGAVTTGTVLTGSYEVSAEGRVTLTAGINPPVLYLANSNVSDPLEFSITAVVVGTDNAASLGFLESQISYGPQGVGPVNTSIVPGSYKLATENPASSKVMDLAGAGVVDGAGISGTWDESSQAANVADQAFTATYSITNTPANGSGTLTITPAGGQPANFTFLALGPDICTQAHFNGHYTVCDTWAPPSATKLVAIPSDATQTNPAVLILEQ